MTDTLHIVTRFDGIGGTEAHASSLANLLGRARPTILWTDRSSSAATQHGAKTISPFSGQMPRGGTLILLGTHIDTGIWLDHVRPKRLIVICNLFSLTRTFAFLSFLERPTLPKVELEFISETLKTTLALPGRVSAPLIDLNRFHPSRHRRGTRFRIGRHSRDELDKHHPDDPSLYKMLAWNNIETKLMGGVSLKASIGETPNVNLLPIGTLPPEDFLGNLDTFFYRTSTSLPEAAGLVVIEAMASGLPVLAYEHGGYRIGSTTGKMAACLPPRKKHMTS
jgi:glycosyltransferase involved in cell wall biosynthesis